MEQDFEAPWGPAHQGGFAMHLPHVRLEEMGEAAAVVAMLLLSALGSLGVAAVWLLW